MASTGVHIEGLRETVRDLERMGVDVADLKEAFSSISRDVAGEAAGLIQVDTGAARATIRVGNTKNKAIVRAGAASAPYVGILNYGWPERGIAGSEFLTGPANDNQDDHVRKLEANLEDLIRKYQLS